MIQNQIGYVWGDVVFFKDETDGCFCFVRHSNLGGQVDVFAEVFFWVHEDRVDT